MASSLCHTLVLPVHWAATPAYRQAGTPFTYRKIIVSIHFPKNRDRLSLEGKNLAGLLRFRKSEFPNSPLGNRKT